jgi:D-3-phosphoglycerate dehydrogenase / 2-oxoglutarate reductase
MDLGCRKAPPASRPDPGSIGLGRISRRVAMTAHGFGLWVLATDPYVSPEVFAEHGAEAHPLDRLLVESDFVIHTLLSEARGLLAAAAIGRMKPDA